jgi:glutathione reductase (NADPH)
MYASHFSDDFQSCEGYGWDINNTQFSWQKLISNKNGEIQRLNAIYQTLLDDSGVRVFTHRASLVDGHTVNVNGQTISANNILIATGGWPVKPEIPGIQHAITSNESFFLERLPEKVTIAGGGYIAVEFAGIFAGLGVKTTLMYRGPLVLRGFDNDMRQFLSNEIQKKGVNLKVNTTIDSIEKDNDGLRLHLNTGTTVTTDEIMFATGRKANTTGLGLENAGIETDKDGAILVNDDYQTNVSNVYAIGDVSNSYRLTPVAIAEGMAIAHRLYGNHEWKVNYNNIPSCIFSQPNFATVGLSEELARSHFNNVEVYTSEFTHLKHTLTNVMERSLMKLVVDAETNRVLGAHMVGQDAGEVIQGIAIAMTAGATKAHFDSTIGIHPTAAEEFVTMRTKSS